MASNLDAPATYATRRIVRDPEVLSGKPAIEGTRIPVSLVLNLLAHGYSVERVIEAYPILTRDDVRAALLYASVCLEREATGALVQ